MQSAEAGHVLGLLFSIMRRHDKSGLEIVGSQGGRDRDWATRSPKELASGMSRPGSVRQLKPLNLRHGVRYFLLLDRCVVRANMS